MEQRVYIAIDLKSFYASVECVARGLDPLTTHLVVADDSRTEKTICLAVSPSLKAYGISGRARLFEVVERMREVNWKRQTAAPGRTLTGESYDAVELRLQPERAASYITAPPRMAEYIRCSTEIYGIYLRYIAPEDIHVYSIDEVFIDATPYLATYRMTARELAAAMMRDVFKTTGITATTGIGTNLYLSKVAMDIVAKHAAPDENGMRIAELDEQSYREQLWSHRPLTDFWRVGCGYAKKLERCGLYTMGDIARCSLGKPGQFHSEELLYRLFGVNAELLIDHAWGWEPCTIEEIKDYRPENRSFSSGQVLTEPYSCDKARIVVQEMADAAAFRLVDEGMLAGQMTLTVGYDVCNLTDPAVRARCKGEVTVDYYGRAIPKHAHGTANLGQPTASAKRITQAVLDVFDRVVDPALFIRRLTLTTSRVEEDTGQVGSVYEQLDLFTDETARRAEIAALEKERRMQQAMLSIRSRFGRNAILRGMDLQEGATTQERNRQIGGHRAE